MWIEKVGNHYVGNNNDGKMVAKAIEVESVLHALWIDAGRPNDYVLEVDDELIVHKIYKELPKG